jgi:uncharacterized Zn finger protein
MKLIHLVAVEQVEVGDVLILGATRYAVTSIEDEINGRDFRLKDAEGNPKCHLVASGEKVTIEL